MQKNLALRCLAAFLLMAAPVAWGADKSSHSSIAGSWSTTDYFGDLYDPSTNTAVASYAGSWYKFSADGHYTYALIASGQLVAGVVITKGSFSYSAHAKTLHLRQKTESFYPSAHNPSRQKAFKNRPEPAEITMKVKWEGPNKLILYGSDGGDFKRGKD